jgi:hypothetical protein
VSPREIGVERKDEMQISAFLKDRHFLPWLTVTLFSLPPLARLAGVSLFVHEKTGLGRLYAHPCRLGARALHTDPGTDYIAQQVLGVSPKGARWPRRIKAVHAMFSV